MTKLKIAQIKISLECLCITGFENILAITVEGELYY